MNNLTKSLMLTMMVLVGGTYAYLGQWMNLALFSGTVLVISFLMMRLTNMLKESMFDNFIPHAESNYKTSRDQRFSQRAKYSRIQNQYRRENFRVINGGKGLLFSEDPGPQEQVFAKVINLNEYRAKKLDQSYNHSGDEGA